MELESVDVIGLATLSLNKSCQPVQGSSDWGEEGRRKSLSGLTLIAAYCVQIYFLVYKTVCYLVFRAIGPLTALIYLNLRLIKALQQVRQRRSDLVSTSASRNTENITLMLVVVVFIFVVCELPDLSLRIIITVQEFGAWPPNLRINIWTLRCYNAITNCLLTVNSGVNFLIYCLVGKKFRQIFCRVYGCGYFTGRYGRGVGSSFQTGLRVELTETEPIMNRFTVIANTRIATEDLGVNGIVEL